MSREIFIQTFPSATTVNSCKIHPLVIFNILDHYVRRETGYRVIGTLLGIYNHNGTVEIRNSFAVVHYEEEGKEPNLEKEDHKKMIELHQKVYPKELVVGWYSSGKEINDNSQYIHDFFQNEIKETTAIHLTVDTSFSDLQLGVKAYIGVEVLLNNKLLGMQFLPIQSEIKTFDSERIGLNALVRAQDGKAPLLTDLQQVTQSVNKLIELLDVIMDYVEKVANGKIVGDPKVGRFLIDTLSSTPKFDTSLEKLFNNHVQDLLMVVYLANLARAQLVLAEKGPKIAT